MQAADDSARHGRYQEKEKKTWTTELNLWFSKKILSMENNETVCVISFPKCCVVKSTQTMIFLERGC